MARRKLNQKKRFKIFRKIFMEENKEYWHNVALLEKLWEKIPQCNTNTLNANEVFDIIKKEKIKIGIHSICKFFKITLIKTNGKKFVIFNKNNKLIINYHNESDIFNFLGHIFHNFLDGAYFKYPFKKHTWDLEHREKLAKKFAVKLKLLIDAGEIFKASYQPIVEMGEIFKLPYQPIVEMGEIFKASYQPIVEMGEIFKLPNEKISQFEAIELDNNQSIDNNNADSLLTQEKQYYIITGIKSTSWQTHL
ncbi:hypothetical protein PFK08_001748 [Campylobacter coli]|nr:hypothetical protein [Campylobacter coli]